MEFGRTRLIEHLAVDCPLSLLEFCDAMRRQFRLPAFQFDFENDTEWELVEYEGIEYNVSRPVRAEHAGDVRRLGPGGLQLRGHANGVPRLPAQP